MKTMLFFLLVNASTYAADLNTLGQLRDSVSAWMQKRDQMQGPEESLSEEIEEDPEEFTLQVKSSLKQSKKAHEQKTQSSVIEKHHSGTRKFSEKPALKPRKREVQKMIPKVQPLPKTPSLNLSPPSYFTKPVSKLPAPQKTESLSFQEVPATLSFPIEEPKQTWVSKRPAAQLYSNPKD